MAVQIPSKDHSHFARVFAPYLTLSTALFPNED